MRVLTALNCPGLTGTLPKEYGMLKNLEVFEVSGAQLNGMLPAEWADATAMRSVAGAAAKAAERTRARINVLAEATSADGRRAANINDTYNQEAVSPSNNLSPTQRLEWHARAQLVDRAAKVLRSVVPKDTDSGVQLGMMKLQVLKVTGHNLSGGLPNTYARLQQLRVLDLSRPPSSNWAGLSGTLPSSYAALEALQVSVRRICSSNA